jgi:hypothetical protein
LKLPIVGAPIDAPIERPATIPRVSGRVIVVVGAIDPDDGLRVAKALAKDRAVATNAAALIDEAGKGIAFGAGAALAVVCDPVLVIAVDRGLGPASWTKAARSIRDRVDVTIAGDRGSLHAVLANVLER